MFLPEHLLKIPHNRGRRNSRTREMKINNFTIRTTNTNDRFYFYYIVVTYSPQLFIDGLISNTDHISEGKLKILVSKRALKPVATMVLWICWQFYTQKRYNQCSWFPVN